MPKEIPPCPKKPNPPPDQGCSYKIELVTPMFGGGVKPRINDASFPIRPTSIRGQLQFWWRATVGAQYTTREELRAAQSAVWGSTERASRVQVRVELLEKPSEPKVCAVIRPNHKGKDHVSWEPPFCEERINRWGERDPKPVTYALFPFQGKPANRDGPKVEPASCIHTAKFQLTLICHKDIDFAKQVEPAIWAWVNFGGLGSRTRRGCGAVLCKDLAPKDNNDLEAMWLRYMPTLFPPREWPTLGNRPLVHKTNPADDPIRVWDSLIGLFKHFRQGLEFARNSGQQANRPGRSRYPEPETIRRITGKRSTQHARIAQIPDDAFPRAELGLPIVFHFQGQGEPPETVLYPKNDSNDSQGTRRERMASPLILKPLALQSGKAIPLILRLNAPALTGVDLRRGDTSLPLPPTTVIRDRRLASYRDSPLAGSPNGSAIEAFLAFARDEGFTEAKR